MYYYDNVVPASQSALINDKTGYIIAEVFGNNGYSGSWNLRFWDIASGWF